MKSFKNSKISYTSEDQKAEISDEDKVASSTLDIILTIK